MNDPSLDKLLQVAIRVTPQWLAGFFDGEGCVVAFQSNYVYRYPQIHIVQKDGSLLCLIAAKFPVSSVYTYGDRNRVCRLTWNGEKARDILTFIKDHVIAKREQVELALKWLDNYSNHSIVAECVREIRHLNGLKMTEARQEKFRSAEEIRRLCSQGKGF